MIVEKNEKNTKESEGFTEMGFSFENITNRNQAITAPMNNNEGIALLSFDDEDFQRSQGYLWYDEYADNKYSYVTDQKDITVDQSQINLTQEKNSQFIPFDMPRYYDGIDLTGMSLLIHFVNKQGHEDFAVPVNVAYNATRIRFAWLVDDRVTAIAGEVTFEIIATGVNEKGDEYKWLTKPNGKINILSSLKGNGVIVPSQDWTSTFITQMNEKVSAAQASAKSAQDAVKVVQAEIQKAIDAAERADMTIQEAKTELSSAVDESIETALINYYTKPQIETLISDIDYSDIYEAIDNIDGLASFNVTYDRVTGSLTFFNGEIEIKTVTINSDPTEEWVGQYNNVVDSKINTAIGTVTAELNKYQETIDEDLESIHTAIDGLPESLKADYYTKQDTDTLLESKASKTKINDLESSLAIVTATANANKTSVGSLGNKVADLEKNIGSIDTSPKLTYEATYDEEQIYTLWEIEGEGEDATRTPKGQFKIQGGSGSGGGTSSVLKIEYITTSPVTATVNDRIIIKYNFSGTDSSGDIVGSGNATWKVGKTVVANNLALYGENEFDITDFISLGTQKITLSITDDAGSLVTKTWTVQKVDIRLESNFNDNLTYPIGVISFDYTPYGAITKTIHFKLDGTEIKAVETAASGIPMSCDLPAQTHGAHLLEAYITAMINGSEIESNHIIKDIIWFDSNSDVPVISCESQNFTAMQYDTKSIVYSVYDPRTETPTVTLSVDDEVVSTLTMDKNTQIWQFKSSEPGEHTLKIQCKDVVKVLTANVEKLDIDVEPVTAGLVFDFNPVGKSNNNTDRLWSYDDIHMTVSDNFDWINGGYQIDENGDSYFGVKAGTSAVIDYKMFENDAKRTGKEFKLVFKTSNVRKADATFLQCLDGNIGLKMNIHEAYIHASADSLYLPYSEEDVIEFEFNISKNTEDIVAVIGYEDGVSTRPMPYSESHNFTQAVPKDIEIGSEYCDVRIYRMKVYNTSLTNKGILNNFIADARSAEQMIQRYQRNQIYDENGLLMPDALAELRPDLRIIKLDVPYFTNDKKNYVKNTTLECIYKNGDTVLDNWKFENCYHAGQGTTSNEYGEAARNIDVICCADGVHQINSKIPLDPNYKTKLTLGDDSVIDDGTGKIAFTRRSVPTNWINYKVNVASSEMANNAILQKRFNDYLPYASPAQLRDDKVKNSMEFVNCVIFLRENDPDLTTHREFNDTEWHFYSLANMGDSKKTDLSRAYDSDDMNEFVVEVSDNTLPNSIFPTGVSNSDGSMKYPILKSEWVAGNEKYDALYNGWDDSYEFRYDCCGDSKDGDPTSTDEIKTQIRTQNRQIWRDMYEWVITSPDEEFVNELGNWFIVDSALYFYLFTHRYTMIDNRAKNTFWHYSKIYISTEEAATMGAEATYYTIDNNAAAIRNGYRFDLWNYDDDSSLGINNSGELTMSYGKEDIDYKIDGNVSSGYIFNAAESVFWCRIRDLMLADLRRVYQAVDSNCWNPEHLINEFDNWQNEFCEELWRLHYDRLYLRTYRNGTTRFLTSMMNGRKKYQRRQFERDQAAYMGTKYISTDVKTDQIMFRCNTPKVATVAPDYTLRITPYSDMYVSVVYGNSANPKQIRAKGGVEYTITTELTEMDDTAILIYCASRIQALSDLSKCYIHDNDFSKAVKLQELIIGNDTEGYENTFLTNIGIGNNVLLRKLDLQNTPNLAQALNLSKCENIEELKAFGSGLTGITFANGGRIMVAELPAIGSMTMKNLKYMKNLNVTSYDNLTSLVVENSDSIDSKDILNKAANLERVRLTGIDWRLEDNTLLERIYRLKGIDSTGYNIDQSVLAGTAFIPSAKEQLLLNYNRVWADLTVTYNTLVSQYVVTFVNDDDTILDVQYIDKGELAVDPITRRENPIPIPTKASTVSTNYTYTGWTMDLVPVFANQIIKATYAESVRQYTVRFVSHGVTMQETIADYGSSVFYTGEAPIYTAEEAAYKYYLFSGWDKSGYVDGDVTINALFDSCEYNQGYFDEKTLSNMRPVEIYAMIKLNKINDVVALKDALSIPMGNDLTYDDIEEHVLINEKTVFTGSNYIDTGIKLFEEDRDFVLAIDYQFSENNADKSVLAQCYQADGSNGFKLWINGSSKVTYGTSSVEALGYGNRDILVLRHIKGSNKLEVYSSNLPSTEIAINELNTVRNDAFPYTLVFGCDKADDGSYEHYSRGFIYWAKLWYTDLGESACQNLAAWTHESVDLEVSGFKQLYLSDGSGSRNSLVFTASKALNISIGLTDSMSNSGGWATSKANKFLNTRFYNAIPTMWKQLLKQVKISSTVGDKLSVTSQSNCYVAIPSVMELDAGYNYEPYSFEAVETIPYMTSNSARIRKNDDEIPVVYWTRSPNASYQNYFYSVNASGEVQGYQYGMYNQAIVIQVYM